MRSLAEIERDIAALEAERLALLRAAWLQPDGTKQIAHALGINQSTLRVTALRHGFGPRQRAAAWSAERLAELDRCWRSGVPRAEIARRFRTSEGRIAQIVAENGWPRRLPGRRRRAAPVAP